MIGGLAPPYGSTPRPLNFSARVFQPPSSPFPSGTIMQNLFNSKARTEQRRNLPASFEHRSSLYFLPLSSQARAPFLSPLSLQQSLTPPNKQRKLASPNLIQDVTPLHLSQMQPLNFPPSTSARSSKDLASAANQLHIEAATRVKIFH